MLCEHITEILLVLMILDIRGLPHLKVACNVTDLCPKVR